MDTPRILPTQPGVYIFKDVNDQILYVGKAKNLKSRVTSYFGQGNGPSTSLGASRPWAQIMVGLATNVETIVVKSELEALMLEANLIKQHQPKYNIRLTDDKAYPFIKFVPNEPIPRFTVVRSQLKDQAKYFGPYLSAWIARETLELLRDIYGIHISPKKITPKQKRPCFNCQLNNHPCPIADKDTLDNYRKRTEIALKVIAGQRKELVELTKAKMDHAAAIEQFELAARLRDRLSALTQTQADQQAISTRLESYEALGLSIQDNLAVVSILKVSQGKLLNQNEYYLAVTPGSSSEEIVEQFLVAYYGPAGVISRQIELPVTLKNQADIEVYLHNLSGEKASLSTPMRGDHLKMVNLANLNAETKLALKMLKKGKPFEGLLALQQALKLEQLPTRIEAVDISNLGASEAVGATVCFINGVPDKNEYRRYKIKTVTGQNDFAMIGEVIKRRFSDPTRPVPDLMVIDGGPEQLHFAATALTKTSLHPKHLISLAKKPDRIFLLGKKTPLPLPRGHKGLRILSQIRDEVHRFAIGFQRHRQSKKSLNISD